MLVKSESVLVNIHKITSSQDSSLSLNQKIPPIWWFLIPTYKLYPHDIPILDA